MAEVLSSDGVTIVHDDLGPRDGVPVVLCHGLAAAGEQLAADAAYFAGLGYRVLVPDLRGHGRSGKPPAMRREDFSIPRMADDMVAMLEQAGVGPVHWVGNSLGGILALQLLAGQAHRFRSLATFGTAYRLRLPRWGARVIPLSYALLGRRLNGRVTAQVTTREAAARPLIARLIRDFDPAVGRLVAENLTRYDLIDNAVRARLPILLLRGGRDGPVNRALRPTLAAMQGRENFRLVELPEGGHCANLDATAAWRAALLRFWAGR
ncbi:MAG TPA: alpha/beta fold hydrolase [Devosiaceae bacterium]|nr:alpha/beta fold hydrolase [Devosiaceae bacterium]